ncbi:hypothetical protein CDIMF43_100036 [Carnobacterium divergens]|nr:hypothetical protein CDIMF43_100036 [Carnobacterium divergens]
MRRYKKSPTNEFGRTLFILLETIHKNHFKSPVFLNLCYNMICMGNLFL